MALYEALNELAALDPRQARLVEVRFFTGLTFEEAAHVLADALRGTWKMDILPRTCSD